MTTTRHETAPASRLGGRWRRLVPPVATTGALALGATYLARVDPSRPGHYPLCPTFALTGIYCPGCGMLRATHDLLHGDVAGAMGHNPIALPVWLLLLAGLTWWLAARWRGVAWRWDPPPWLPYAAFVGVVAFTVARNLPGWTWLSPA
ncbi:MAG TPA: DUF2752 domain-containing protein [Dermatophilaceae bacterium]|nr:DUF2752 domain-containing protein [Dermatophilaceae bacterium]